MYARHIADRELTFDFAEGLLKNNLLIVDRETDSVWSQLHGKAVIGPLEGQPLTVIPSIQATWGFWKARHPDTRLMVLESEEGRPYFYRNRPTGQSSPRKPKAEHDLSALGFGLALGNEAIWIALDELNPLRFVLRERRGARGRAAVPRLVLERRGQADQDRLAERSS